MKYLQTVLMAFLVSFLLAPRPEALISLPEDYNGEPRPVLYWLHWYNGSAQNCPYFGEDFIVVSPVFRPEADWKNYDLQSLVKRVESRYPASDRWIEGYSRGAYGAVWHAAKNPGLFSRVTALAGGYPDYPNPPNVRLFAGKNDKWLGSSVEYARNTGHAVRLVDSSHNPKEFYSKVGELY